MRHRDSIVLGSEFARANAIQDARGGAATIRGYDSLAGETDLWDPAPSPTDDEVRALCREVASAGASRAAIRTRLHMDDFYTLLTFAARSAVRALRERDPNAVREALAATSVIDAGRIDPRDLPLHLSLVHHAAARLGLPDRPADDPGIEEWGYAEFVTPLKPLD